MILEVESAIYILDLCTAMSKSSYMSSHWEGTLGYFEKFFKGYAFMQRVSPQLPPYVGGGVVVTTYLELLSSNLVCKPNLGANFDF